MWVLWWIWGVVRFCCLLCCRGWVVCGFLGWVVGGYCSVGLVCCFDLLPSCGVTCVRSSLRCVLLWCVSWLVVLIVFAGALGVVLACCS